MYSLQLTVPAEFKKLRFEISFATGTAGFFRPASGDRHLVHSELNHLLLYPRGEPRSRFIYASVRLPEGGSMGRRSALLREGQRHFLSRNLTTLIDSPVLMGRYFRGGIKHSNPRYTLHIAAIHGNVRSSRR